MNPKERNLMKTIYNIFFIVLVVYRITPASSADISGIYDHAENWDFDTLNVTGNVSVLLQDTESIIINPGTTVLFHDSYSFSIGNSRLKINGSEEQPVRFTTSDTSVYWNGIYIDPTLYLFHGILYTPDQAFAEDTMRFTFCCFERCSQNYGAITITISYGRTPHPLVITGCKFTNNNCSGIYIQSQYPSEASFPVQVIDCLFENNAKTALYIFEQNPTIRKNNFYNNHRGGIELYRSSGQITDNIFENNQRDGDGSALFAMADSDDTLLVTGNMFTNNSAGPAVSLEQLNVIVTDNSFSRNQCSNGKLGGGGLFLNNTGFAYVARNTFSENSVTPDGDLTFGGGGLNVNGNSCRCIITNNLFVRNSASTGGAIHFNSTDSIYFFNNTVCSNTADLAPAIYFMSQRGMHYISNSIFNLNQSSENDTSSIFATNTKKKFILVSHCLLDYIDSSDTVFQFQKCLTGDPEFTDITIDDFSLTKGSPAIDAGDNDLSTFYTEETDISGNLRIFNETIDLGAFEYQKSIECFFHPFQHSKYEKRKIFRISIFGTYRGFGPTYKLNGSVVRRKSRRRSLQGIVLIEADR